MSNRVLIRQGGATSAGTTDFNVFTGLKGAPAFDQPGSTLISAGMRWADGEASAGTFKILDPNAEVPKLDLTYNLQEHALVTITEDASGCAYWMHRGRVSGPVQGGKGNALAGNAVEFDVVSDDGNVELKGQAFTAAWVRPQETDYDRLVALQAYTLNGSSSTATYHRNTCQVVVLDSHFCKNANTVTMPATTYPIGTQPLDVVADCATTAGKDYGVVIHHAPSGGTATAMSWSAIPTSAGSAPHWPFCGTAHKVVGLTAAGGTLTIDSTVGNTNEGPSGTTANNVVVGSATNRALLVFTATAYSSSNPTLLTYRPNASGGSSAGDQTFTQIGSRVFVASTADDSPDHKGVQVQAWYLVNPTTSSGASDGRIFSDALGGDPWSISAYVLHNVSQSSPVSSYADGTSSGTTISHSASGDVIFDGIGYRTLWSSAASATQGGSQTLDQTQGNGVESFGIMNTVLQTSHVTGAGSGTDCSHLCLQYIVPTDLTTNPCAVRISDQRSEVDEDSAVPPSTYAPRWLNGKATAYDGQDQLSALVYLYQTKTGSGSIFTQNVGDVTNYDYWCDSVSDSLVETPAEAATRAPSILTTRRLTHVTHRVSIPIAADQLHTVEAGMAVQIKATAALAGQYLGTWQTRRIVQTLKEPRNDGTYWVHMELNRPQRMVRSGSQIGASVGDPSKSTIVSGTYSGQTVQQALETIAAGTGLPLTTLGDMLYRGAGGSNTRLAIGASNTHLTSDGTKPLWSPQSSASGNFVTTTGGGTEPVTAHGNLGATATIDLSTADIHSGTLNANCTLAFSGFVGPGGGFALKLTQDGTGGRTTTFPASVTNGTALAAAMTTTASTYQWLVFISDDTGTSYTGYIAGGSGFSDPMTTIGDIITRNASNITARLGTGTSNTVLTALGTGAAPVWAVSSVPAGTAYYREVLMTDGISSPPEPLTNEAGTDWLYSDTVSN